MSTTVIYCQLHQPLRLRHYTVFDTTANYFDVDQNTAILQRVTEKSYLPGLSLLLELVRKHEGRFRVSLGVTGTLLEQLQATQPAVVTLLQQLAACDGVEFVGETYYHSLAFFYSLKEFEYQVRKHSDALESLIGKRPVTFRNTEMTYDNALAEWLAQGGQFHGVLTEGCDRVLKGRSPHDLFHPPGHSSLGILLRDYSLSDDIGFRFSDTNLPGYPLTAPKFAQKITAGGQAKQLCNIFIDFETFGEHQWSHTGIFDFLQDLPRAVLAASKQNNFMTPSEAIAAFKPQHVFDVPNAISWADSERDLSAWCGNAMQSNALKELFKLESLVRKSDDANLLEDWRRLTISDHFYYMCTKYYSDMAVHNYFSPYESPYDGYINFMNVLDNLKHRLE